MSSNLQGSTGAFAADVISIAIQRINKSSCDMKTIGVDFGTSNSLAALAENGSVHFTRFPDNRTSNPTVLYFPPVGKEYFVGNEGINRHFEDLEHQKGGGRLMFSIKSLLSDPKFDHTTVPRHGRMTASNLVANFIGKLRVYSEREFDQRFDGVVLGRPVDFSDDAIERLRNAALEAGFKEIFFCLEPVAAAISYEATIREREIVCVVDLGGGTSDICIVEVSASNHRKSDRTQDIKAVGGVNLAGDELSSTILRAKLAKRFGGDSTFISMEKEMHFPAHILAKLSRWHRISQIKNANDLQSIAHILISSSHPEDVARLQILVNENLGYELYKSIETAKVELSTEKRSEIRFPRLNLDEYIRREDFERGGSDVFDHIRSSVLETLSRASLNASQVGHVLLTGGTSQIPIVQSIVEEIFGAEKVLRPGFHSTVASGLAHLAVRHSA